MLSVSTQIARGEDLGVFAKMLESVSFADEIIIFNMERSDQAAQALFKKYQAHVIEVKTPKIVEEIRARQIEECKGDWVLIMDYDETIPPALHAEIISIAKSQTSSAAYAIGRDNFSLGYPLRHGGWGQDYVVRLIRRADFRAWPTNIHSTPVVSGETSQTKHAMEHHKDHSLEEMVAKTNRYSEIEASQFFAGGLPQVTSFTLLRKSVMEFLRRYFFKSGFLDGRIGLMQSLYQGYSVFISYAKLYEKQKGRK